MLLHKTVPYFFLLLSTTPFYACDIGPLVLDDFEPQNELDRKSSYSGTYR